MTARTHVRIPVRFQRRGGRKRIVAPDGSEILSTTKSQPDSTMVKALARTHRWQRMLEEGGEVAVPTGCSVERVGRGLLRSHKGGARLTSGLAGAWEPCAPAGAGPGALSAP